MTGTIRKHSSRRCNKRVNHEKEWKRTRVVSTDCERWVVRPSAWRRPFDYIHGRHHGHVHEERNRAFRYADSARKRYRVRCERRGVVNSVTEDKNHHHPSFIRDVEDEEYFKRMQEKVDSWYKTPPNSTLMPSPVTPTKSRRFVETTCCEYDDKKYSNLCDELMLIDIARTIGCNI